jgi:aminopeptidase N
MARARDSRAREGAMTGRVIVVAAGLVALCVGVRVHADTYPRQTGFTIVRYSFDVTLSDATNAIQVSDTVEIRFTAAGVTGIDLDLCGVNPQRTAGPIADPCVGGRRGRPSPGGGGLSGSANEGNATPGMTVTAVTADGRPLRFVHRDDRLHVDFPRPSEAGGRLTFTVVYHGTPSTGLQIGNNRHGDRGFFSNDWPDLARNWLATVDHPSMKAATAMTVTAPRKYQVISNGRLVEETDLPNDLRRTSWEEDAPIPSWQISLGAAPFAVRYFGDFHGIALSAWVYPQERDDGFKGFGDETEPILEFYLDHIGPYSYAKLAQVEANTVSGGMELASDIYYGYRGVPGRQLIAHEMAHQWFGDSATEKDWDDVWLSEGFATYFALLYEEHADGRDAFLRDLKRSAQSAIRYNLAHPESTIVHDNLADVSKVIANNAQIYQGGAQVLHMLRGVLGDDRFWAGIRLYYSRYRNANASSDDFRRAMQDACIDSGPCPDEDRDLSWFFHEWLNRGGVLQVTGGWHYDAAAHQLAITIDQTQTTGLYRMPIEIGITQPPAAGAGRGGRGAQTPRQQTATILVDQAHNALNVPLDAPPTQVELDPQSWVTLMQATFGPRAQSGPGLKARRSISPEE